MQRQQFTTNFTALLTMASAPLA